MINFIKQEVIVFKYKLYSPVKCICFSFSLIISKPIVGNRSLPSSSLGLYWGRGQVLSDHC